MCKIWPGVLVVAYHSIDECWRLAEVIRRYGEMSYKMVDSESGNYPDLVTLRFHGELHESRGHFTYGVVLRECYLTDCPVCKKRHMEESWRVLKEVALSHIPYFSHKQMCKLLHPPIKITCPQ